MSSSLVKRGLHLFSDDLIVSKEKSKKKKSLKDPLEIIGTNKKGMKKQLQKLQRKPKKTNFSIKDRSFKSVLEEYKVKAMEDLTEENVKLLKQVSRQKISAATMDSVLENQKGRLAKNQPKYVKKEEETTVFTEEDFQNFEEYLNSGDF